MDVYNCGTDVKVKRGNFEGHISAIQVKYELVSYEVTFWNGAESMQQTIWLHESEFITEAEKRQVGFKSGKK